MGTQLANVCNNLGKNIPSFWLLGKLKGIFSRPGLLYAILSCLFFASSSVLVHIVNEIHAVQTVFFRSLIQLLFTVPMMIFHSANPLPNRENYRATLLLVLRGIAGSSALCFQFYALQTMPLSDATVIIFSSPIFTGILAYCFLSERWSKLDAISGLLCFLGVVMIAQPGSSVASNFESKQHFISCIVALSGAVLTSISIITLKKLQSVHYVISSFYLALVGVIGTGLVCTIPDVFRHIICGHQFYIVLIGLCAVGGQCLLCKSLCTEKASTVALVRTFDIVLAFVFQMIFLNHQPNVYSVIGAILVSACNIVILSTARSPSETPDDTTTCCSPNALDSVE
ncbi:solute carrier family 35 member G1-like [Dendronephthya gigantea]|uniref:solute carrier family 35 member G1-like n=1 Tax=Dendronephthya gigantea TaxID=151771 RepID=UPI00106A57F5|nr:solute carrier family 35 member G1-like [Dendronephthya gigantea]